MYQKCPICSGTGVNWGNGMTSAVCQTCHGQKIISELTGLAPSNITEKSDSTSECEHEYPETPTDCYTSGHCIKCGLHPDNQKPKQSKLDEAQTDILNFLFNENKLPKPYNSRDFNRLLASYIKEPTVSIKESVGGIDECMEEILDRVIVGRREYPRGMQKECTKEILTKHWPKIRSK